MLVCRKSETTVTIQSVIFIIFIMISIPITSLAQTSGITIDAVSGQTNHTMLNINAEISYHLSKETTDALDHGIPLEFNIEIRIKRNRNWLWDKTIISKTITYRVEFQPLSGQYLVTELYSGDINQFHGLEDVLEFMGILKDYPVIGVDMLSPEYNYVAQIKSHLNIQALPAPLRPLAYLSSQWHLASSWRSWTVHL